MIKSTIKWMISKTPWRIVRTQSSSERFVQGAAIKHNSQYGWDEKFGNPGITGQYLSPARKRLNEYTLNLIDESRRIEDAEFFADVGCGLGHLLEEAQRRFQNVNYFGYDFSSVGLEAAKLRCSEVVFEKHNIYDPLPRKHHITVCSQTLEHLQHPERAAYNLVRGTADGGIVVFTVPDGRLDQYKGHIQFWSPESWETWVEMVADGRTFSCHRMEGGTAGGANLLAVIKC
ncbi:class I SAM-dependent methyltransferase [Ancylobacter polymorphus]|uniref:Class I SAM-dependent methyltransferase n=1 Tax=Ancylobacter polymorphus TaxID=223390 RepID=A0A9E7CWN3_9HYPH|nr:class I SAM-dependent methyltransferase [Ancylobacter polymorphus]UOK72803.1 class I SAM-dependent methyltransferase [Ancylobacter polymorphus]